MKALVVMMVLVSSILAQEHRNPYNWESTYQSYWVYLESQVYPEDWTYLEFHVLAMASLVPDDEEKVLFVMIQYHDSDECQILAMRKVGTSIQVRDRYGEVAWSGPQYASHSSDEDLPGGSKDIIGVYSSSGIGGWFGDTTAFRFRIPNMSGDPYDAPLSWGNQHQIRCGIADSWEEAISYLTVEGSFTVPSNPQSLTPASWASIKAAF